MREVRKDVSIPLVFMTYANVVFSYGAERFISTCAEIGIDGMILPDLPYEEKDEFLPICCKYGVDLISMIAPTSENRIAMIAKEAEGFLYIVSIVGSAIIKLLEQYGKDAPEHIGAYVKSMKDAVREYTI